MPCGDCLFAIEESPGLSGLAGIVVTRNDLIQQRKKKINPQADKLVSICKALDISLVDLLCDEDETTQQDKNDYIIGEKHLIEIFRESDLLTKRKLLRYFELVELCREINLENDANKIKRNVSVIQDADGNNIVVINDIIFKGKRSVEWSDVEKYLRKYVGDFYQIGEKIKIAKTVREC